MPKKLIRTYSPINADLEKVMGRDVDLVLRNKAVHFGRIEAVKLEEVIFRDKINNKIVIPIHHIMELIVDEIHSF